MNRIALVGNFPPRKCGIATFTNDLNDGININGIATSVIAMNDGMKKYTYPSDVVFEIEQNEISYYVRAAQYINTNNYDAVVVQHEFGIFGGPDGRHLIQLLQRLTIPVITTLHTILDTPTEGQRMVINEIARLSQKLICISKKGIEILNKTYGIPKSKCQHIHHGVHPTEEVDKEAFKEKLGVKNKKLLLTFGLLSRNKSLEVVINALPGVVKKHPDLAYIILGATHPHVIRHEGEAYRRSLAQLAEELGLRENVIFIDRFVSNEELFEFLKVCDIYVIPYLGEKQISSGTLIYAMGAGKPVISTPFWYAEEMLADGRGLLFDFSDSGQLTEKIIRLLDDEEQRLAIANRAFEFAAECYWHLIGKQYIELLEILIEESLTARKVAEEEQKVKNPEKAGTIKTSETKKSPEVLPPLNLNHLREMTDTTGILQHARYTIPDRTHGYCTDDNARALMLCVMLQNYAKDRVDREIDLRDIDRLTSIYLSFIDYSWNPENRRFRNFMSYDRRWMEDEGSQDCAGRTLWALGYTAAHTKVTSFYRHANHLFQQALEDIDYITHPRALAYLILGLTHHAQAYAEERVTELLRKKANQLASLFDACIGCKEWPWFDRIVTYGNSRIPQALIAAGIQLKDRALCEKGLKLLNWLIEKQFTDDMFNCIGNFGWMTPETKAAFDQQPLEAHGMIDSCLMAEEYLKDGKYAGYASRAFEWYTGNNACSSVVYDALTGGCRDGLHRDGVNLNEGAESTLSWLMSLVRMTFFVETQKSNNMLNKSNDLHSSAQNGRKSNNVHLNGNNLSEKVVAGTGKTVTNSEKAVATYD